MESKFNWDHEDQEHTLTHVINSLHPALISPDPNNVKSCLDPTDGLLEVARSDRGVFWSEEFIDSIQAIMDSITRDLAVHLPETCPCDAGASGKSGATL